MRPVGETTQLSMQTPRMTPSTLKAHGGLRHRGMILAMALLRKLDVWRLVGGDLLSAERQSPPKLLPQAFLLDWQRKSAEMVDPWGFSRPIAGLNVENAVAQRKTRVGIRCSYVAARPFGGRLELAAMSRRTRFTQSWRETETANKNLGTHDTGK